MQIDLYFQFGKKIHHKVDSIIEIEKKNGAHSYKPKWVRQSIDFSFSFGLYVYCAAKYIGKMKNTYDLSAVWQR